MIHKNFKRDWDADFLKLVGSIVDHVERIQEKGTQSTQFSIQSVKITFILYKCHRFIDNASDFYLFILS